MAAEPDPIARLPSHQRTLVDLFLSSVPADGTVIGNTKLRKALEERLASKGVSLEEDDYWHVHAVLVDLGVLAKGRGRGGSVRLVEVPTVSEREPGNSEASDATASDKFDLETRGATSTGGDRKETLDGGKKNRGAKVRKSKNDDAQILSYRHGDKRVNNPEVGMVTPTTDPNDSKACWAFDPNLHPALNFDPQRAKIEKLIDEALASDDTNQMREALEELKRLQSPYLDWAGKSERTTFEVDTVSLHVHERIDPASILSALRKNLERESRDNGQATQPGLFDAPFENLPLRYAIDFYRHERGWANRLVAGDSLLVMNSLLQKESMAGRVQMIYIDPPYGIKYGSNFQPFVGKRAVKDRSDADLTQEPEMIKAFRDTWELGIHSYLTYLRDRLLLARELLSESGSVFVQISDENLHHVRELMDDVFGVDNFVSQISFTKAAGGLQAANRVGTVLDYIVWYAKDASRSKFNRLFSKKRGALAEGHTTVVLPGGYFQTAKSMNIKYEKDVPAGAVLSMSVLMTKPGPGSKFSVNYCGRAYESGSRWWGTTPEGLERVKKSLRAIPTKSSIRLSVRFDDFPYGGYQNLWSGFGGAASPIYVVQTNAEVVQRCLLMTTDPGDLVLDPTCGSGTTAFVAEKWGRRWITCDTSRVAVTLAKQRLMTANYDYFELKYPHEGLKGGFVYKVVPHVTLKSIANNPDIDTIYERLHPAIEAARVDLNTTLRTHPPAKPFIVMEGARKGQKVKFGSRKAELNEWEVPFNFPADWNNEVRASHDTFHTARQTMQRAMDASIAAHADQEILYDQPTVAKDKLRISGPFTVEAVPFPSVKSLDEADTHGPDAMEADTSIARTGESGRQHQWRDELLKTGIRGKGGQLLKFADLEALPTDVDIRNLHASGHLDDGQRVVVSFGPEHAALEQRQVANALNEAGTLFPPPKMIVYCAFTFDPEAAKDIDALKGITALKAQMNIDLLTEDLKKGRASNQSFWLMGQPEVEARHREDGFWEVEVHGFDYFDTVKGELVSGGKSRIAMWSLDTDYDERSLFPRQVFFPMAGKKQGWEKLRASVRAELDEARLDAFHGTVSLPFETGENRRIAVKIVDDRGIESLKVVALD